MIICTFTFRNLCQGLRAGSGAKCSYCSCGRLEFVSQHTWDRAQSPVTLPPGDSYALISSFWITLSCMYKHTIKIKILKTTNLHFREKKISTSCLWTVWDQNFIIIIALPGIEPRALDMICKYSKTNLHQSLSSFLKVCFLHINISFCVNANVSFYP